MYFIDQLEMTPQQKTDKPVIKNEFLTEQTNNNLTNIHSQKTEQLINDIKSNTKTKVLYIPDLESITDNNVNSGNFNQTLANQQKNFVPKISVNKSNQILLNEKMNINFIKKENILLKEENQILKRNVQILNEKIQIHQNQINKIKKINKNYEITIDQMKNEILELHKKLDKKEKIISDYESTIKKINELILKDKSILTQKKKLITDINSNNDIESNLKLKSNFLLKNFEKKTLNLQDLNNYCFRNHLGTITKNKKQKLNSPELIYDLKRNNKNKLVKNIKIKNLDSNYIFKNSFSNNSLINSHSKIIQQKTFPNFKNISLETSYRNKETDPIINELNKSNSNSNTLKNKRKNLLCLGKNKKPISCNEKLEEKDSKKINKNKSFFCISKSIESNKSSKNDKYSNINKLKKLHGKPVISLTSNNSRIFNLEKENFIVSNLDDIDKNEIKSQRKLCLNESNNILFNKIKDSMSPRRNENKLHYHNLTSFNDVGDQN